MAYVSIPFKRVSVFKVKSLDLLTCRLWGELVSIPFKRVSVFKVNNVFVSLWTKTPLPVSIPFKRVSVFKGGGLLTLMRFLSPRFHPL